MALGSDSFFAPIRFGSTDQDKEILFPDSNHSLWSHLAFLTPPVSPSTLCASENSKETNVLPCCASPLGSLKHLSEEDLDEEPCHFSRQSSGSARCQSPAILNDIMWSGYRAKRPDSAMDVDMSFSLASTPVPFFDQCLTSTVITEDLFLFSADEQRLQGEKDKSGNKGFVLTMGTFYDAFVSDSEEEIDVVGVTEKHKKPKTEESVSESFATSYKLCNDEPSSSLREDICTDTAGSRSATRKIRNLRRRNREEGTGVETNDEDSKTSHNDLERKRRNDLKNRFNALRSCVPLLRDNDRAPKISILRKGADIICELQRDEKKLLREKEAEKTRNQMLLQKLAELAKQCKTF